MDSSYIYSVVRTRTLASALANEADVERLLIASSRDELRTALLESYLSLYVTEDNGWSIDSILESHQLDAIKLLLQISPDPLVMYGYLARYDFHNVRVLTKSSIINIPYQDIVKNMSPLGLYSVEIFYENATQGTLYRLGAELQKAYNQAMTHLEAKEVGKAEMAIDSCYWSYRRNHVEQVNDSFLRSLLALEIDFYNAVVRLRSEVVDSFDYSKSLQSGGFIPVEKFATVESTQNVLSIYGGELYWQDVFQSLHKDGLGLMTRLVREYIRNYVHITSYEVFCTASLIDYMLAVENSADVVRTIVTGRESGLSESSIRSRIPSL